MSGCRQPGTVWAGHPLRSARLILRPLTEADAPRLVELLDDWEVVRLTCHIPYPCTLADAHRQIALHHARRLEGTGVMLAMERTLDGCLIGCIGFGLDRDGMPELGYWLGSAVWGQGYGTEAVNRLTRHLFEVLDHPTLWASIHPDNHASRQVLAKAGFVVTATDAVAMPARGQSVAMPVFSLERAAWEASHAARPMVLVVAAALVDADGRVMMASRPPGKTMAGLWEFPGGKVHQGETPEAALVRELREELGIDTGESCLAPVGFASHDYDTFHLLMPLYVVRVWKGTPVAQEGQSLRWVRGARLSDLPMPPADIPLVAILREWI